MVYGLQPGGGTMSKEIFVAIIALFGSGFVSWFAAKASWRLELGKWRRARDDIKMSDLRSGLQQLIFTASLAAHSMCWLTWLADSDPVRVTKDRLDQYDAEMHKLLPQLLGNLAFVASIRPATYGRFKELIDDIFIADGKIATAAIKIIPGVPGTASQLATLLPASQALEKKILDTVRSVLANVTVADESIFQK
jgi:hypothetical protein